MVPGHSPRAVITSPLGKQQVMTETNLAVRGVWPRIFSSSRRYRPVSSRPGPPYRAEYTPGAPSSASTHRPESSAMAGIPVASITAFALSRELSSKVSPVSSTSTCTPSSDCRHTSMPRWERISFISLSFFSFWLANTSFIPQPSKISFWRAMSSSMPFWHRATSCCCSAMVNARPSPVPCSSTSSPRSFITQFKSTIAEESSS